MAVDAGGLLAFVLLVVSVGLLALGLVQARRAARMGGITIGLARTVIDPKRGRRFLVYLTVLLAAFLFSGAAGAVGVLFPAMAGSLRPWYTLAFASGVVAIFLMLTNGITAEELTFSEALRLQEERPQILGVVEGARPVGGPEPSASMYVVMDLPVPGTQRISPEPDPTGR